MFADAENAILPALLLILVLYSATAWVIVRSFAGKPSVSNIVLASLVTIGSGLGLFAVLAQSSWPPDQDEVYLLHFGSFRSRRGSLHSPGFGAGGRAGSNKGIVSVRHVLPPMAQPRTQSPWPITRAR
jgi:hypothetical protein